MEKNFSYCELTFNLFYSHSLPLHYTRSFSSNYNFLNLFLFGKTFCSKKLIEEKVDLLKFQFYFDFLSLILKDLFSFISFDFWEMNGILLYCCRPGMVDEWVEDIWWIFFNFWSFKSFMFEFSKFFIKKCFRVSKISQKN